MTRLVKPEPRELDAEIRAVPLASLGLPAITRTRLAYNGVRTLGELSDWCGPDRSVRRLLGKGRAHALERAVEAFWAARKTAEAEVLP